MVKILVPIIVFIATIYGISYFWSNYLPYIHQFWIICSETEYEEECQFANQNLLYGQGCIYQSPYLAESMRWIIFESSFGLVGIHYTQNDHIQTYILDPPPQKYILGPTRGRHTLYHIVSLYNIVYMLYDM